MEENLTMVVILLMTTCDSSIFYMIIFNEGEERRLGVASDETQLPSCSIN